MNQLSNIPQFIWNLNIIDELEYVKSAMKSIDSRVCISTPSILPGLKIQSEGAS
jgi:hypothetical protein